MSKYEEEAMSKDEVAIEAEIQAKGLNAPRLTPQLIDDTIVAEAYRREAVALIRFLASAQSPTPPTPIRAA